MSEDMTTVPPPQLRLFSAGIRFFDLTDSLFPNIFPLLVRATSEQEAIRTAWGIFKDNTHDEKSDLFMLMEHIILPFHVGVVDCTDLLGSLLELAREDEPQKPKRKQRKPKGNVVELFPKPKQPKKRGKKEKDPPPDVPPKK